MISIQHMTEVALYTDANPTDAHVLDLEKLKLPVMKEKTASVDGSGGVAAMEFGVGILEALSAKFNLKTESPEVMKLFGLGARAKNLYTARGVIVDTRTGERKGAVAEFRGSLNSVDRDEFTRGDIDSYAYEIGTIDFYRLTLGDEVIYHVDVYNHILTVGGEDRRAEENRLLGLT